MNITRFRLACLTALLLLTFSHAIFAANWYRVEVIIFANDNGINAEKWPEMQHVNTGNVNPSIKTANLTPAKTAYLGQVAKKLNNSKQYRVLYHRAWNQTIVSKRNAQAVTVETSNGLLEGHIKVFKGRYLHAAIDVWLKENGDLNLQSGFEIEPQYPANPHLNQSHRIDSKKLIYFDHPRVAAIIEVIPLKDNN